MSIIRWQCGPADPEGPVPLVAQAIPQYLCTGVKYMMTRRTIGVCTQTKESKYGWQIMNNIYTNDVGTL